MSAILVVDHRDMAPGDHPVETTRVRGGLQIGPAVSPDFTLWAYRLVLEPGTVLEWGTAHGDEALLVLDGIVAAEANGASSAVSCVPGDAFVVEHDVAQRLRACGSAELLHLGGSGQAPSTLRGPVRGAPSAYRLAKGAGGALRSDLADGTTVTTSFWADSTRPSCRIALLEVSAGEGMTSPSHSHSRDEIIHVTAGVVRIGRLVVEAGMSALIPADVRYSFRAESGYSFVNFRDDMSSISMRPGTEPLIETAASLRGPAAHA